MCSVAAEKFEFEGKNCVDIKYNGAYSRLYSNKKAPKKGAFVTPEVQFSNTFVEDLNEIAKLSSINYLEKESDYTN
ncbi:Uncharacterised protein [Chryseobacterium nakagawai]|uniref:Uncharacterized protein n=1 Tax=Chryseobacterium nakagawai TaxID=1241982 RepID=A0AAD0YM81_CHRNA|nr:hypothetical protein EG343_03675 [Chryseobacterium nakagawai]VEH21186.1 Uncharacterised protein [Chryseobacterium nakagawai]